LSIGTNDLLQYTVAVDRNNDSLSAHFTPYNPAFLQLLLKSIKSGVNNGKPVAICGELAADLSFTAFLLCAGVSELSVGFEHVLPLRKRVSEILACKETIEGNCTSDCAKILNDLTQCETAEQTIEYIQRFNNNCGVSK